MNQEIKDIVALPVAVVELGYSVADGVSLGDVLSVVGVLKKVKPAVDAVKSGKLLDEYKGLDEAGKADLVSWFDTELDIPDDKVEAVIEQGFAAVVALNELAKLLKP